MKSRIYFKLLGAFVLVIAVATLTLDFSFHKAWEESFFSETEPRWNRKLRYLPKR